MVRNIIENFIRISGVTYADISIQTKLSRSQLHKLVNGQTFWTTERVNRFLKMFQAYGYNKADVFKKLVTVSNIIYLRDRYYFDEDSFRGILNEIDNAIDSNKK